GAKHSLDAGATPNISDLIACYDIQIVIQASWFYYCLHDGLASQKTWICLLDAIQVATGESNSCVRPKGL
ncbi:hypothetical protein HAX54_020185, partial [Datura stramonium]|nr:hypothetical protein [Datura stramonium]